MKPTERTCVVHVDGTAVEVAAGASAITALVTAGTLCTGRSVSGQRRFALCGMGQCQECRLTIDGRPQQLACRTICRDGMRIVTGASE